MAHFAKLNEHNIVQDVHCVHNNELLENGVESEEKGVNFLITWSGGHTYWKQTSYNGNFRKNYAGVGYTYDNLRNAFISPKPHASWIMNEDTCQWTAPTTMPTDGKQYQWDEPTLAWIEVLNSIL